MADDFQGKVALVTGAARGIGQAIARGLADGGARVLIADVLVEEGQAVANTLGPAASFVSCDVSDASQVRGLFGGTVERFGRVDIAVNNAGINTSRPEERVTVDAYPDDVWHRIMNVDLHGTFYCCRAAASAMAAQGSGSIVNIASIAGVVPLRLQLGFVAAKAAVIRMTEAMACELGPRGVRVNCVSPGSTLVEGTRELFYRDAEKARHLSSFIPQGRPGEASEIAEAVLFLASEKAAYINGHNIIVDGGWTCGFTRDF